MNTVVNELLITNEIIEFSGFEYIEVGKTTITIYHPNNRMLVIKPCIKKGDACTLINLSDKKILKSDNEHDYFILRGIIELIKEDSKEPYLFNEVDKTYILMQ